MYACTFRYFVKCITKANNNFELLLIKKVVFKICTGIFLFLFWRFYYLIFMQKND